jgi:low affinity Fe/Cu permease
LGDLKYENVMRAGLPVTSCGSSGAAAGSWFSAFATKTAVLTGKPASFLAAATIIAVWAISGPIFNYSDTWQLVINTGTTIVTFLMVFLIQHTQNRDTIALQVKLDELILASKEARNELAAIEDAPEEVLESVKEEMKERAGTGGSKRK